MRGVGEWATKLECEVPKDQEPLGKKSSHTSTMLCHHCHQELPLENFTQDGLRRKRCKTCVRVTVRERQRGTEAKRLLSRVRANCRKHRWAEGSTWTLEDVEALLAQCPPPLFGDRPPRLRVVRCDAAKPFTMENARVVPFGL